MLVFAELNRTGGFSLYLHIRSTVRKYRYSYNSHVGVGIGLKFLESLYLLNLWMEVRSSLKFYAVMHYLTHMSDSEVKVTDLEKNTLRFTAKDFRGKARFRRATLSCDLSLSLLLLLLLLLLTTTILHLTICSIVSLSFSAHLYLAPHKMGIDKQCRPKSDST